MSDRAALLEARAAVHAHRQRQATAEQALARWLRKHRAVPPEVLYDQEGDPLDPALKDLHAAVAQAAADVRWCQAVTVACAEAVKGEPFETVVARNASNRPKHADAVNRAIGGS